MITPTHQTQKLGFTLVEVAMALGVFAFGIVPVIGLINVGLQVNKDSADTFGVAQIIRHAGSGAITSGTLYYLNTGEEDTSEGHVNAIYQAAISGTATADAAQGLLARKILEIKVSRVQTGKSICTKTLELSRDPVDLQDYF